MSIDAMKQALEEIAALRAAIEQAEKQEPVVNIELSRRMAAVKVSNFYGSIIKDAEKEIERLHGLVLQHTAPPQQEKQEPVAWQGLTREETVSLARQHLGGMPIGREFVDAVEALLREKNTAPPQRQPLTREQVLECEREADAAYVATRADELRPSWASIFARAIERKHGIGGGE